MRATSILEKRSSKLGKAEQQYSRIQPPAWKRLGGKKNHERLEKKKPSERAEDRGGDREKFRANWEKNRKRFIGLEGRKGKTQPNPIGGIKGESCVCLK